MSDPAGVGELAWSDADLVFGAFGSHAGELAPLYAGALMPALAATAVIRRWSAARVPLVLAIVAILWSVGLAGFLAHPFGPLRSITAHQAVRALPLLALAIRSRGTSCRTPRLKGCCKAGWSYTDEVGVRRQDRRSGIRLAEA